MTANAVDFSVPQRAPDVVDDMVLADGTHTPVRIFRAEADSAGPLVVLFPGLGTPASYFDLFATRCSAAGVSVACADLRGQGASRPRPSRASVFGQQEMVVDDVPSAIAVARRHVPDGPLYLAGHSMGGHIASLYAARQAHRAAEGGRRLGTDDSHRLSGLILIASGVPFRKLYRGGSGLRASLGPLAMYRIAHAVGFWPAAGRRGLRQAVPRAHPRLDVPEQARPIQSPRCRHRLRGRFRRDRHPGVSGDDRCRLRRTATRHGRVDREVHARRRRSSAHRGTSRTQSLGARLDRTSPGRRVAVGAVSLLGG